jgi:transcription elongation factor GreA
MADDDFLMEEAPEEREEEEKDVEKEDGEEEMAGGGGAAGSLGDEDQTLVTKEGLKKLKEELDYLKTVRRKEVAQRLKEAISYGDLSENSEYEEAKNEQAFVEGRIIELELKVKNAKIISEKRAAAKKGKEIEIGSTITVRNKTEGDEPETFVIVGSTEADPLDHKISNESPLGKAFLGNKKGDVVVVTAPAGDFRYEILKVQ